MADLNTLSTAISSLAALSMATERLVELVKNTIPQLNQENSNPTLECWRNTALRLLAVGAGILVAYFSKGQFGDIAKTLWDGSDKGNLVVLGLLASGGSGFWNSVLKYVGALKDVKKAEAGEAKKPAPNQ